MARWHSFVLQAKPGGRVASPSTPEPTARQTIAAPLSLQGNQIPRDLAANDQRAPAASGRYYRPELDLLRFSAFALVFVGHAFVYGSGAPRAVVAIKASGALGVPLFFMLSAYLITDLLLRERRETGTVDLRAFYLRRILRIWPLYLLALLAGAVLYSFTPSRHLPIAAVLSYLLLVGNWYTVRYGYLPPGLIPLWSISVEEQFYVVWPSIVRRSSRRTLWAIVIAAWLVSQCAVAAVCLAHVTEQYAVWSSSLTQLQYFALGAFASLAFRGGVPTVGRFSRTLCISIGLVALFIANFAFAVGLPGAASMSQTYPGYLFANVGVGCIFVGVLGCYVPSFVRPGVWLGKISYGLYVYHAGAMLLVTIVCKRLLHAHDFSPTISTSLAFGIALPLTIALAHVSYRYFETPFLRLKHRFEVIPTREI